MMISKRRIKNFFNKWYLLKTRIKQFFCPHEWDLKIFYTPIRIIHGPVRGKQVTDIKVVCEKCHKTIIHQKGIFSNNDLYTVNWDSTKSNYHRDPINVPQPTILQAQWLLKVAREEEDYQKMLKDKGLKDKRKASEKPWRRGPFV